MYNVIQIYVYIYTLANDSICIVLAVEYFAREMYNAATAKRYVDGNPRKQLLEKDWGQSRSLDTFHGLK